MGSFRARDGTADPPSADRFTPIDADRILRWLRFATDVRLPINRDFTPERLGSFGICVNRQDAKVAKGIWVRFVPDVEPPPPSAENSGSGDQSIRRAI
ncbi:MAG: hypothetical protein ACYTF1_00215 [Planctomycetota bacterium]